MSSEEENDILIDAVDQCDPAQVDEMLEEGTYTQQGLDHALHQFIFYNTTPSEMREDCYWLILTSLVSAGADISKPHKDFNGTTPLHIACERGDLRLVQYMLENMRDQTRAIHVLDSDGIPPFFQSLRNRKRNVMDFFYVQRRQAFGIDVNASYGYRSNACTALHYIMRTSQTTHFADHERRTRTLLQQGAKIGNQDGNGENAIHLATHRKQRLLLPMLLEAVPTMVERQAIVNTRNSVRGETPLMLLCRDWSGHGWESKEFVCGMLLCGQKLLRAGADLNICNHGGINVLGVAAQAGNHELAHWLLLLSLQNSW